MTKQVENIDDLPLEYKGKILEVLLKEAHEHRKTNNNQIISFRQMIERIDKICFFIRLFAV